MARTHSWSRPPHRFPRPTGTDVPTDRHPGLRDALVALRPLVVDDYQQDVAALVEPPDAPGAPVVGAILGMPLVREGRAIGFLALDVVGRAHIWRDEDIELLRVATDIIGSALARRDTSEASRAAEARFRALVEHSSDALIVIDHDARISHLPIGTQLFGYRPEDLVGVNALDLVHPDDLDFAADEMIKAVTDPSYQATNAMRIRHADGHWVPIELVASSHFDDPAIDGVIMNVRDHSERDRVATALRESEERLRLVIGNLPGAVFRCDARPPYRDEFISDMIETLTGYRALDFVDGHVSLDELIPPDHRRRTDQEMEHALAASGSYVVEYPIRHRDGTVRWLSEHGQVLHDASRQPEHLEGFIFDVTSRVDAVNETRETEMKLASLVAKVPGAVFRCELTPPYRDLFMSEAIEELTGYPHRRFSEDLELYDLVVDRHRDGLDAEIAKAIVAHRPYLVEYQIEHRDGRLRWIEERGQVHYGTDGEPLWIDGAMTDLTLRKELEERLAHDATHDPLTGLLNRTRLLEHLEQALVRGERLGSLTAVLFVDLDRFKLVNDALGHTAGDELLVHFTRRLRSVLRESDLAARPGGDEFVIVCTDLDGPREAEAIANRVSQVLSDPFTVSGRTVFVTASIGIAYGEPDANAGDLLRSADAAAYRAKDRGRNRYEVFDDALRAATSAALELETDLHRAIDRHQLFLRYQPIVELPTGHLLGAEALIRWQHPGRGLITPDHFLPAAEASGLIVAIGNEMLDLAVGALSQVPATALPGIALNISPRELAQRDLVDRVRDALVERSVDPRRLTIEITENAVLDEIDVAVATLQALREVGVRLAIDDFGTGYSSLSYLRRLPVDTVKIDRSFTNELGAADANVTIVAGIIGLARGLGLDVVAEGVETQAQADMLVELGCTRAQGFLYAPPLALDELLRDRSGTATAAPARDTGSDASVAERQTRRV